jgi:TolB-like protein
MTRPWSRVRAFGEELRRRRVFRVAVIYAAAGWVAVEASDTIAPLLLLPDWTSTLVVVLLLLGLPLALGLAWSFDITTEGIRRTGSGAKYRSARNNRPGQQGRRWTILPLAVVGVVAVLALAGAVAIAVRTSPAPSQRPAAGSLEPAPEVMRHSVAVLPFSLLGSQAPDDVAFAHGLHDDLLTRLAKITALRVTSRTSVMGYVQAPKPLPIIGRELGVRAIVEGSVQRAGGRVRLNVQLIDAETDQHLWADAFERPFDAASLFELQTELTEAIAGALHARLLPEESARVAESPTRNLAAWQLVQDAGALRYDNQEQNEASIRLLERALALDSLYGAALSGLAFRYYYRTFGHGGGAAWADSAAVLARHALEVDAESVTALHTLALVLFGQDRFSESRTAHQRALAIELRSSTATNLCWSVELYSGRLPDAAYWCRVGALLDPISTHSWWGLGLAELALGRMSLAREYFARVAALDQDDAWTLYFTPFIAGPHAPAAETAIARLEAMDPRGGPALGGRAVLSWMRRDTAAFLEAARRYHTLHPEGYDRMLGPAPHVLGAALTFAGRHDEARVHLEQGLAVTTKLAGGGRENPLPVFHAAQALALLGRREEAGRWLDRAYDLGFRWAVFAEYGDPVFAEYGDPAFAGMAEIHGRWLARIKGDLVRLRAQADARVAGLDPLPPPPQS